MNVYRADLHVHTVLSPCGALEMSPKNIVRQAVLKNIDILGITDHNSTYHTKLIYDLAKKEGIEVYFGCEVCTAEEVHCLAFFESYVLCQSFQKFLDEHLADVSNDPAKFGYQVVVDENEDIIKQVDKLLISGLKADINEVEKEVHRLDGLFIPAHIDRPFMSIISQLGFIPGTLRVDAVELSQREDITEFANKNPWVKKFTIIQNSDAHYPDNLGEAVTQLKMASTSFSEFRKALKNEDGREVIV
jgi:PHP family Zn ribbon phosphoesterase